MSKLEMGVSTNCNCGKTIREILENIKAAGFSHVMFSEYEADCSLEDGLRLCREVGLKVQCVHLDYKRNVNSNAFWIVGESCEHLINYHSNSIELCARYGVNVVCLHVATGAALPPMSHTGVESVKRLIKVAERVGVKIAIENLGGTTDGHMCYLLDNIDSPMLGFCYDSGHSHNWHPDTPLEFIERYGHRCFAIHLHDNHMDALTNNGWCRDLHLLPFDGKADWVKVMQAISKSSYNDVVMMELKRFCDGVSVYPDLTDAEYLKAAYGRGERLAKMLQK